MLPRLFYVCFVVSGASISCHINYSLLLKKACVRQVVLDKWFLLIVMSCAGSDNWLLIGCTDVLLLPHAKSRRVASCHITPYHSITFYNTMQSMDVHTYACHVYTCLYVRVHAHAHVHVHVYTYGYAYTYMYKRTRMCTLGPKCAHACTHARMRLHAHLTNDIGTPDPDYSPR